MNPPPDPEIGAWLNPFLELKDVDMEPSSRISSSSDNVSKPARRGRGRPRVSAVRDPSAIERRRTQVRNAQRAFQERKDSAMAMEKQKTKLVLQVLSDLSTEIQEVLRVASLAGVLHRNDEVGGQMRRLRDKFNETTSHPSIAAELEHIHNAKERTTIHGAPENITNTAQSGSETALASSVTPSIDWAPVRTNESTLITPYTFTGNEKLRLEGRNIFQVVAERQAAMRNAERQHQG